MALTAGWQLSKMSQGLYPVALTGAMLKLRKPRNNRRVPDAPAGTLIPDKLYFRIGEVSKLAHTKPYVLRYWETEFPTLKPTKSSTGHRLYRRQDVEMVFEIKRLLYEEGFTIDGARKYLAGNSGATAEIRQAASSNLSDDQFKAIRRELLGILTIVSR